MTDKEYMQDLLNLIKGGCELYMHGTIEASTPIVIDSFYDTLSDGLNMQGNIYKQMQNNDWYKTEQVSKTKINQVKTKYQSM